MLRSAWLLLSVAITAQAACNLRTAAVVPPSTAAAGIQVAATDPPAGAELIGPVEAVHGHGCGLFGKDGTLDGATNALKEAAARRGANYVRVVSQVEPHMKRDCFDHEYRVRGVLYRVAADLRDR